MFLLLNSLILANASLEDKTLFEYLHCFQTISLELGLCLLMKYML